jgi:hypothetical protein
MNAPPPPHRRIALAIVALLAGIYLLTASSHTYSIDEELMFGVTESLVQHGSFALNAYAPDEEPTYSQFGPGQSVAAVPFYLLGQAVAALFSADAYAWVTRAVTLWLNSVVTACTAALIYLAAITLGYGVRPALGTALLYGLATMAWPHSKTFFAEPLTALLVFAAFAVTLRAASATAVRTHYALLAISGVLAGLALPVKIQAGLFLPLLALHAVLCRQPRLFAVQRATFYRGLAWGAGCGVALALLMLYQTALFGSPEKSGYGNIVLVLQDALISYPLHRFRTLTVSSGRGIIWFAPPVLLWLPGMWLLWRRSWPAALTCGLVVAANIAFYSMVEQFGDGAWGPRFLNLILPFLAFPLVGYLAPLCGWHTPWRTVALLITLLLAIPVQTGALLINPAMYIMESDRRERYYNPTQSPIVAHLSIAARQVQQWYTLHHAPGRVGLLRGFSYSEGHRSQAQQVPRWTHPHAEIGLRPPTAAAQMQLQLALERCLPQPLPAAPVSLQYGDRLLFTDTPCPPRNYHLLLPAQPAVLRLEAPPWDPAAAGIERVGPLGVKLRDIRVVADGATLPIAGKLVPIEPLPPAAGPVTIRKWTVDYRYAHWDFWWWYLAHSGFASAPRTALLVGWLLLALVLMGWGGWQVRGALRSQG